MKKNFRLVVAIVAMICLICTFAACNKGGDELDRGAVTNDFVSLGLKKFDANCRLDMSANEIKALEDSLGYISAKNYLLFGAEVLEATSIRTQKLSRLNTVLESDNSLFSSETELPGQTAANGFNLLSSADLTSEDISDLLYTLLDYGIANGKALLVKIKADVVALKASYVLADFESQGAYDEAMEGLDEVIASIEGSISNFDAVTAEKTNVSKTIKDAKEPLTKFFDALSKISLTLSSEISTSIGIDVNMAQSDFADSTFNITAKPEEISTYVASIKTGFQEVSDLFSDDDVKSVSNAMLTIATLIEQIDYSIPFIFFKYVLSVGAVALNLYQPASGIVTDGLGAVNTAFAQSFIDIEKEGSTYVKENYAILYAKFAKAAIGKRTATELKAKLDTYKAGLGTDTRKLSKHLVGLVFVGNLFADESVQESTEPELDKVVASLILDNQRDYFVETYYNYISATPDDPDKLVDQGQLDEISDRIYTAIEELKGSVVESTKAAYSKEWFKEILQKCDTTLDSVVVTSINSLITFYKKQIDSFFTNKIADINELAGMALQTETSDKYGRLVELEGKTGYGSELRSLLLSYFSTFSSEL